MKSFLIFVSLAAGLSIAQADEALATAKNCMSCHNAGAKSGVPSFKEIAQRYGGKENAAEMLSSRALHGGSRPSGPIYSKDMPPLKADEAKKLADWILTKR